MLVIPPRTRSRDVAWYTARASSTCSPGAARGPASTASRSWSACSRETAASDSSAFERPPAAASTSTLTRPRSRWINGSVTSTPRMRSSGIVRTLRLKTPECSSSFPSPTR